MWSAGNHRFAARLARAITCSSDFLWTIIVEVQTRSAHWRSSSVKGRHSYQPGAGYSLAGTCWRGSVSLRGA